MPADSLRSLADERSAARSGSCRGVAQERNEHNDSYVMDVAIGIDPHKATRTAVAFGDSVTERLSWRGCRFALYEVGSSGCWRGPRRSRSAAGRLRALKGSGFLLAQQVVAADQVVVDVPATLAARTRLLGSGRTNKNDRNDALSVAATAWRHRELRTVTKAGYSELLRLLAKRHIELSNPADPARRPPPCPCRGALIRWDRQEALR